MGGHARVLSHVHAFAFLRSPVPIYVSLCVKSNEGPKEVL